VSWINDLNVSALTGFGDRSDGGQSQTGRSGLQGTPQSPPLGSAPPWSPDNGLFIAAVVIAVTFGLIGFSTHYHVGPAKGSLAVP
jgi:hypothetical protein